MQLYRPLPIRTHATQVPTLSVNATVIITVLVDNTKEGCHNADDHEKGSVSRQILRALPEKA